MGMPWLAARLLIGGLLLALAIAYVATPPGGSRFSEPEGPAAAGAEQALPPTGDKPRLSELFGRLFVANRGQLDERVAFTQTGGWLTTHFTSGGLAYSLLTPGQRAPEGDQPASGPPTASGATARWVVGVDFLGARQMVPVGAAPAEAAISFFRGRPDQWVTAPTAEQVQYVDLWPGVDLAYEAPAGRLKSTYRVRPGADPSTIALLYRGAADVRVDEGGRLLLDTGLGPIVEDAPYAYQEVDGRPIAVRAAYAARADAELGGYFVRFEVGPYDPHLPLVIDPGVDGGYFGDNRFDEVAGVGVDQSKALYLAGSTESVELFDGTVGPYKAYNGDRDAFVAKVNPAMTALVYGTYIGGAKLDQASAVAIGPRCASDCVAYVAGTTRSSTSDSPPFPVEIGPDLTYGGGRTDAFVAAVEPDGKALRYVGYIGGQKGDGALGIAADAAGAAYVAGITCSSAERGFPAAVGPDLVLAPTDRPKHISCRHDGFVAKVRPDGTGLAYAGYIGGNGSDSASGIAVDRTGAAYVAGIASPGTSLDNPLEGFPLKRGPGLVDRGRSEAFAAKVKPSGAGLIYSGLISGEETDFALDVDIPARCRKRCPAYVVGSTNSSQDDGFPVSVGPDLIYNGNTDAFVAAIKKSGKGLSYAGYIGGSKGERAEGVAVTSRRSAHVAGFTNSSEAEGFPVLIGPDLTYNNPVTGVEDAFLTIVAPGGGGLAASGYIGGATADFGRDVVVDCQGNAYVVGGTESDTGFEGDFPVNTFDTTFGGVRDGFFFRADGGAC